MPYITQEQYIGILTGFGTQEITLLQYTVQESGTYYATVFLPAQQSLQFTFKVYLNGSVVGEGTTQNSQQYSPNDIIIFTAQQGDTVTITLVVSMPIILGVGNVEAVLAWYDELSFCITYQPPVSSNPLVALFQSLSPQDQGYCFNLTYGQSNMTVWQNLFATNAPPWVQITATQAKSIPIQLNQPIAFGSNIEINFTVYGSGLQNPNAVMQAFQTAQIPGYKITNVAITDTQVTFTLYPTQTQVEAQPQLLLIVIALAIILAIIIVVFLFTTNIEAHLSTITSTLVSGFAGGISAAVSGFAATGEVLSSNPVLAYLAIAAATMGLGALGLIIYNEVKESKQQQKG
ncbi:hypothetical protein [Saccharolobus sp.]|uniref:hypothetical protein n=1 Tax=Saccharolobus sp. TaxID=2100761 RepID=UPI003171D6B2